MKSQSKTLALWTASLLVLEAVAVTIPVIVLQTTFEFPAILRQPAAYALERFSQHQSSIVSAYYLFLLSSLLYLPLSVLLKAYSDSEEKSNAIAAQMVVATGIATALFQAIGFCRWIFTIPMLSQIYFDLHTSAPMKEHSALMYDMLNRYAGMTIGEHLGFIAMGAWTCCLAWGITSVWNIGRRWMGYGGVGIGLLLMVSVGEHVGGRGAHALAFVNLVANTLWTVWILLIAFFVLKDERSARSTN